MIVLTYQIDLQQPILATSLGGDANSVTSFNYLPGTVLRGALIAKHPDSSKPFDKKMFNLFIDGDAIFLNGYPMNPCTNQRSLPKPASWRSQKKKRDTIHDFALTDHAEKAGWEGVDGHFCTVQSDDSKPPVVTIIKPERYMAIHTARNREYGRARAHTRENNTTLMGAVYRFEALASKQSFVAHVLCKNEEVAQQLEPLLQGSANLGKAINTNYGRVTFHHAQCVSEPWYETKNMPDGQANQLTITFLSDAIFRNRWGQYVADANAVQTYLESELNCMLQRNDERLFLKNHLMGGFNRTWGLPLPQMQVIGMGSVLTFAMPKGDDMPARLSGLIAKGIGEKRVEGFGRIGINWQMETQLQLSAEEQKPIRIQKEEALLHTQPHPLLKQMVARLLRQKVDNRLLAEANMVVVKNRPQRSQLYRLRQQLQMALSQSPEVGRNALMQYIKTLQSRAVTRSQFAKARVEPNIPMFDWLVKFINQETLAIPLTDSLPVIDSVQATVNDEQYIYETNLRFLDIALARIAKIGGVNES